MPRLDLLRLRSSRWPLLVLLISIGLTAVAAIDAQRAIRSQQALAERALREYASFAAWSYEQHLELMLNSIEREAVGAVNHGDAMHTNPRVPDARELAHYLPWDDTCMCHRARVGPNPDAFFAFKVGQRVLDVGVNTHPNRAEGWEVDRPMPMPMSSMMGTPEEEARAYTPAEQKWILDSLPQRVRHLGEIDHGYTLVVGNVENAPRIIAYTLMPTSWGDTMVYGARYTKASFVGLLQSVLDSPGLLPATFSEGRRNRDILTLRVSDHGGRTLFASPGDAAPHAAHIDLPARAGLLQIDAAIRPELAGTLLVGGLPRSHLPFLLGLLGVAAALSIVAVAQLRREGDLARLRGDFVSSVSHELRTPLAQIRLYLETLQLGRASTEEQRRWSLSHIERETTRLSHLVENVLRFNTLGRSDPTERAPVNVADDVARIVDEFQPLAASRRATVRVFVDDAARRATAMLRPDALRHVTLNLIDNAVKYGPVGAEVDVRVQATENEISLIVDDQGPGIAETERELIWRPFLRGEAALTNGGSGIGLTIVREVAEANGGHARVESAPGGGARFVVSFPTARAVTTAI